MIDPALAFLYFGLPTMVGLIGLAAVKLHERSEPPVTRADSSASSAARSPEALEVAALDLLNPAFDKAFKESTQKLADMAASVAGQIRGAMKPAAEQVDDRAVGGRGRS